MDLDLNQLPPAYRAAFEAQQAQIAALTEANVRLEHLVAEFRQAVYGKKSEKLRPDERQLAFEGEPLSATGPRTVGARNRCRAGRSSQG